MTELNQVLSVVSLGIENFSSPDLMFKIQEEIGKKHIGDDKGKLLVFTGMCNSQLKPEHRDSIAVRGLSSSGKSDLVKACAEHIPDDWYAFGTRFTQATLEDDVKDKNLIIILEKPWDEKVLQTLKSLAEDGMKIWKKKIKSSELQCNTYIPKKTISYTSTEAETDEELSNRFLIYNIKDDAERYGKVIDHIKKRCADVDLEIELESKYKQDSWIKCGLKELRTDFDYIIIPFLEVIPFDTKTARQQRDVKRFINIIRTIAWINQKNRYQFIYKDKKILLASPEDMWWADYLTRDAFIESISGLSPQLETVLSIIKQRLKDENNECFAPYGTTTYAYVDRAFIQQKMNVSLNTIKGYIKALENLNLVESYSPHEFSRAYVRIINEHQKHPLVLLSVGCQYLSIKKIEEQLYKKYFDSLRQANDSILITELTPSNTTTLLDINSSNYSIAVSDIEENIDILSFYELIYVLKEKLTPFSDTQIHLKQDSLEEKGV